MKKQLILILLLFFNISFAQKQKETLKVSTNLEDVSSDYLKEELSPIRKNFKRINSIQKWTKIKTYDTDDSAEGGYINYYYLDGKLEKILVRKFGESSQYLAEYYFLNNKLSFLFEKRIVYNVPFTWEEYDEKLDKIEEDRYYFKNNRLLHLISNQDCGTPFASYFLNEEGKRKLDEFIELIKLEKSN